MHGPGIWILVDRETKPGPEFLEGIPTVTNDTTPTWTWRSSGGKGVYRLRVDDEPCSTQMTETVYTPTGILSEGPHVFSVQELHLDWSASSSLTVEVDSGRPCSDATTPEVVKAGEETLTVTYTRDDIYLGEACGGASSGSGLERLELFVQGPDDEAFPTEPAATDSGHEIDGRFQYTVTEEGLYRFRTRATDRAGNVEDPGLPHGHGRVLLRRAVQRPGQPRGPRDGDQCRDRSPAIHCRG